MSHIFGIIASDEGVTQENIETMLEELCDTLELEIKQNATVEIDRKHGSLLAMGYLLSRCYYRKREINNAIAHKCINILVRQLEGVALPTFNLLASAACQSIAEIGRTTSLNALFPDHCNDEDTEMTNTTDAANESSTNKSEKKEEEKKIRSPLDVIKKLASLAKTSKDTKLQENAIFALGHITIPLLHDDSLIQPIIDGLFATADTKQVELFFAGGEALSALLFGWDSQALQKYCDIANIPLLQDIQANQDYQNRSSSFQSTIDTIIQKYVKSDRSWYRKASCIWLLSILKFGKTQEIITVKFIFNSILKNNKNNNSEVKMK